MARSLQQVRDQMNRLKTDFELRQKEMAGLVASAPPKALPNSTRGDTAQRAARWAMTGAAPAVREELERGLGADRVAAYRGNIENLCGEITLPVGLVGPLRNLGISHCGDVWIPLATSEGALVASYNRGCRAVTEAGGVHTVVVAEGITRAPVMLFAKILEVGFFCDWLLEFEGKIPSLVREVSRHTEYQGLRFTIEGNHLYLLFDFTSGEAAGQNMATIATQRICEGLIQAAPVKPRQWFIESNMSGDKKASMQSFVGVRGKKVTAEALIPAKIVRGILRTDATRMEECWRVSALGGVMSGTIGVQGHFANGLAALFLATGQDVACVAEASVGVTRVEACRNGDIYATVTLPNLVVGTVGGGTRLPAQRACLDLMGLSGPGSARALAEIAGGLCLAGELSINAAMSAGHFASAHRKWGRPGASGGEK